MIKRIVPIGYLTVGKTYCVLDSMKGIVYVIDDNGNKTGFDPDKFAPVKNEEIISPNKTTMQNFDNVPGFIQDVLNDEYFTKAKIKEIASLVKTGKKCSKDIQEQMKLLDNTENKIIDAINVLLLASSRKDIEAVENALTVIKDLNEKTEELTVSIIRE